MLGKQSIRVRQLSCCVNSERSGVSLMEPLKMRCFRPKANPDQGLAVRGFPDGQARPGLAT